jgi:hypothetical protein
MHAMIALRRDEPHWMLNDQDARVYGQALQNALRHIPIRRAQKTLDFAMLVVAACQFEIPRVYLSAQIARQKAAQARRGPVATAYPAGPVPFNPPPPPPGSPPPQSPMSPTGTAAGATANGAGRTGPTVDMSIEPELDVPRFGPQ